MLRFFRNIRKKLLEQSDMRRYLIYALGEILLVMIGILLALQVSNWNEQRQKHLKALEYHQRLLDDLKLIILDMEDATEYAVENFEASLISLDVLRNGRLTAQEDSVLESFLFRYFKFSLSISDYNTYKEMQSAGQLDLIKNIELQESFSELIDQSEFFHEVHRTFHEFSHLTSSYLDPYLNYNFPTGISEEFPDIEYNFKAMASDSILINKISRQAMLFRESVQIHKSFYEANKEAMELLTEEYEKLIGRK